MSKQYEVIIIGAGISGISAAHYLLEKCPEKRVAMLESKS